ncbi:hypothetical protein JOS77_14050 [Chromobacterium haemolyticum]|nr:hypothetical protein JOS77_14050 [Chromobacterium haemolyticum]
MRIQKTLNIGEHQVTIQELTVADIRGLMVTSLVGQATTEDSDLQADLILRSTLLADLSLDELAAMTDLAPADWTASASPSCSSWLTPAGI